jgi:hypothetical protein
MSTEQQPPPPPPPQPGLGFVAGAGRVTGTATVIKPDGSVRRPEDTTETEVSKHGT